MTRVTVGVQRETNHRGFIATKGARPCSGIGGHGSDAVSRCRSSIAPTERENITVLFARSQPRIDQHSLMLRGPAAASHTAQIRQRAGKAMSGKTRGVGYFGCI